VRSKSHPHFGRHIGVISIFIRPSFNFMLGNDTHSRVQTKGDWLDDADMVESDDAIRDAEADNSHHSYLLRYLNTGCHKHINHVTSVPSRKF